MDTVKAAIERCKPSPEVREKLWAIKRKTPVLKDLHYNFICLHYAWIIGVTLVGSIILYPGGNMAYIDALFFASGSATQSGLNTIDVNLLFTYQQVWLWMGSMIANPIVIHSAVVFVRLYWFEQRFQHVVREAKALRRSRSRSRAPTRDGNDSNDAHRAEAGVRGRDIVVIRNNDGLAQGRFMDTPKKEPETTSDSGSSTQPAEGQGESTANGQTTTHDESPNKSNQTLLAPSHFPGDARIQWSVPSDNERHITFLEHQRRQTGALRIPSPREYDRGGMPEALDETDGSELARNATVQSDPSAEQTGTGTSLPTSPGPVNQHITIDEPNITRTRKATHSRGGDRDRDRDRDGDETSTIRRVTSRKSMVPSFLRSRTQEQLQQDAPYLSWEPTIGRNSAFVDLSETQREELGGIEYRALKTLAIVLIGYFFFFHLLGIICLVPWILNTHWGSIVTSYGQGRPWWAVFSAGSAFNDQGFTITPDSMLSFYDAVFPMLLMTFLILIGNTGFPCMLRFVIWFFSIIVPEGSGVWEELKFLLDHPRRCFTLLFPSSANWWLFWVLVLLNGVDLIFFIILDLNDPDVTRIPGGIRFVDGLFQAAATRTAGLSVISLTTLHPAIQVSYMVMMYISVYPIAISVRRTNVYEERSLGIYSDPDEYSENEKEPSFVGAHLQKQLSFDIWYIFLGLFVISIIEGTRLDNPKDLGFSLFAVLFEVVSAYGTVGLSLGYPTSNTSFSGQFHTLSKLVIIAMEIRGRHRGLPYALDRAVLLPSEALHRKEADDAAKRLLRRRGSNVSAMSSATGQASGMYRDDVGVMARLHQTQTQQQHQGLGQSSGGGKGVSSEVPPPTASSVQAKRLSTHQAA
ncbi:high-affinity potassium transporter [Nannizzia gypsea CBS 118893]|uniref:Potassium transport protein n=1 Tax=Arthroderma gypseum (strain ATCC MYA-4604 / CBS 118893) TaxID=535722 RepID=E4US81_ARTGP|nr:high-affinity potassium transporter [Nannizzia gypsea CBS 118893]EFR01285.1 high-affinity potassium transporter [Nannizzia gypsea CBS 118893]